MLAFLTSIMRQDLDDVMPLVYFALTLNLPIYDSYKKICGFVHFSSESFYNIAKASDKSDISLFISRNNRKEDEGNYKSISIELANQFYYFGLLLVEVLFASWLKQKGELKE